MKTKFLFLISALCMCSSCAPYSYYQVFKTQAKSSIVNDGNHLVYSDENCSVSYNFWGNGGSIEFAIHNKSDKNIYLNKKECFFVCNGYAYDYFKDRTYTSTQGEQMLRTALTSYTVSHASGVSASVSWKEPSIICIPPKSTKVISEFEQITKTVIRDCELFRYPTGKQTNSRTYSEAESPLVFCNKLAYYLGESQELIRINNEFYISELTNLSERNMVEYKEDFEVYCGEKAATATYNRYLIGASPEKFYIRYDKTVYSNLKH